MNNSQQGGAAVARLAHNQKVAGSNPAPATRSRANVDDEGTGHGRIRPVVESASRLVVRRRAAATSEHGRDSRERPAPDSQSARLTVTAAVLGAAAGAAIALAALVVCYPPPVPAATASPPAIWNNGPDCIFDPNFQAMVCAPGKWP